MGNKDFGISEIKHLIGSEAFEFANGMKELGIRYGIDHSFSTFIEFFATCLAMIADVSNAEKRSLRFLQINEKLSEQERREYFRFFESLGEAYKKNMDAPIDILGMIFHALGLHNEWKGQFFTPDDVCRLMAMMANPLPNHDSKFETVNDPACGSGAMLLAAAWNYKTHDYDFTKSMLAVAQDIDIRCVWMAYIQLRLYHIPAVVIHQNSLTDEIWDHWHTSEYWSAYHTPWDKLEH